MDGSYLEDRRAAGDWQKAQAEVKIVRLALRIVRIGSSSFRRCFGSGTMTNGTLAELVRSTRNFQNVGQAPVHRKPRGRRILSPATGIYLDVEIFPRRKQP